MLNSGCLICNTELQYLEKSELMTCEICNKELKSNTKCKNGHFICDTCHEMEGMEYIYHICSHSNETNPIALAVKIMSSSKIKMHGPEHHYLVPAVLLTTYNNKTGNKYNLNKKLDIAKERAKNVLGGFCGLYGACGAAIGTGIFVSTMLKATPLSTTDWELCNLITSESLRDIAHNGGPRCCKRDTFLALEAAIKFVQNHFNVTLDKNNTTCSFYESNKQCIANKCLFFPANT